MQSQHIIMFLALVGSSFNWIINSFALKEILF